MTIKKAIEIIDFAIQKKSKIQEGYIDPQKSWNKGDVNISGISKELGRIAGDDIKILELIRAQITPKCKHPINMRDYDGKTWYCMNCNWNL